GRVRNWGVLTGRSLLGDVVPAPSQWFHPAFPAHRTPYAFPMTVAVSAHKGGSEDAPPATWKAYETALTTGAEYVEFDIRRTRDGDLVVFHDPQAAGRPVAGLSYEELCEAAGHRVPLVRDVMKLIAGKAMGHLDLKETGYEAEIVKLALDLLGPENFV